MFKKSIKTKNVRKRVIKDSDDGSDDGGDSAIFQRSKLPKKDGQLAFSTSSAKKPVNGDEKGVKLQTTFVYESNRDIQTENDSRATATLETETQFDRDSRAIREKALKNAEEALKGTKADDKLYHGMAGYKDHTAGFRREHTTGGDKASGAHGPLRASAHIRWSVRFDYQPDICKDYKETGYCGYGDACKFMHDRGDYKSGWQLEREWDEKEKRKREATARGAGDSEDEVEEGRGVGGDSSDEDELPFACFICREPFSDPVVTRCKHYFCEHCALKHNARNKNCFVCNKPTNGVFNTAHEILKRKQELNAKASQQEDKRGNADEDAG